MKKLLLILLLIINVSCAEAQVKVQDLTEDVSPAGTDLAYTIKNPNSAPVGRKAYWSNVMKISGWIDGGTTIYQTDSSDNVAIGTTTATSKLTVNGTVTANFFAGDGSLLTGISGVGVGTSSPNGWVDGGTNVYLTTTSDNVGIGTTTPVSGSKLDVRGGYLSVGSGTNTNATSSGELYVQGDIEADGTVYATSPQFATSTITPKLVGGTATTQSLTYQTTSGVGAAGADHIFKVGNAGATEAMRITNAGNIGVNSVAPSMLVDITSPSVSGLRILGTMSSNTSTSGRLFIGTNDGAAMSIGDRLGELIFQGSNSATNVADAGGVFGYAEATWTNTSIPSGVGFDTVPSGSLIRTERMRVNNAGLVGINTTLPLSLLSLNKNGSSDYFAISSSAAQSKDLMIVNSSGNIGIGTPLPQTLVQIKGGDLKLGTGNCTNTSSNEDACVSGNLDVKGFLFGDGSQLTNVAGSTGGGFTDGGINVYTSTTTDLVGIGTTTPSGTLEVVKQTATTPLMISATATGDGDLLIVQSGGNIGIGSVLPGSKLDVQGGLRAQSLVGLGTTNGVSQLFESLANGNNYTGWTASPSLAGNTLYVMPTADGTSGQALITDGSLNLSWGSVASSAGWTDGGTNIYQTTTTDTVGIGTTTPSGTFELVQQGSVIPLMISSVPTGDGNRLILTSAGNMGIGTRDAGNLLTVNGAIQSLTTTGDSIFNTSGNVGIGTATPPNKLYVVGGGYFTTGLNVGIGTANTAHVCVNSSNAFIACN